MIVVIDTNIGLVHALGLADGGRNKVYYAIQNSDPYPKLKDLITGLGFEEIEKVDDYGDVLPECEYVVFTDSGFGGLADYLRKDGFYVFGADKKSENLELDRVYMRRIFESLKISIPNAKIIRGISKLYDYIKNSTGKKFIKISKVRGDVETIGTDDPEDIKLIISKSDLSFICDLYPFVVEDELEGVEIGVDALFTGKEWHPLIAETIEIKGAANLTKFVDYEDTVWKPVLEKLTPYLRKNGYRGYFCMEGFYDGDKITPIDITPRYAYICSHAYPYMIENYADVILGVARGEVVEAKVRNKYSTQIGIYTDEPDRWRTIKVDEEIKEKVSFRRAIKKDGKIYFVPGDYVCAVAVGEGSTWKESIEDADKVVDGVEVIYSYEQSELAKEKFSKTIEKLKEYGYEF